MHESISEPLGVQRVELKGIEAELSGLQRTLLELMTLLQRGNLVESAQAAFRLSLALKQRVQAAQLHISNANAGLDVIARIAEARRQKAQHLRTLYTVGQAINSPLELRDVLNRVMDNVVEVTRAERGYVVLRDNATGQLTVVAARGLDRSTIEAESFAISRNLVAQVVHSGRAVLTTNAEADPRFSAFESIHNYSLRAIMCAPLVVRGQVSGVVYVDHRIRAGAFTERDLDLLASIADQAALAIDRARVFGYLQNVLASIASGVVTVDHQGSIVTFNRAAAAIFGLAPEQAIGRSYEDVFGLVTSSRLPELISNVRQTGEAVRNFEALAVVPGRGEVVLLLNVAQVPAETGEPLGVVMVLEDVTQQRRMQRYIAPSVVSHMLAAAASPRLGGELREVSILFGDVQGYTTLSEKLPPQKLLDLLNAHLSLAANTIMDQQYGGTLDKYIGDAVMGLFNSPHDQFDHAWRAVNAAWAMQCRLQAFQEALPAEQRLRFRVGVHTGQAVVGHVGSEDLLNYTAIGDVVNVAKRLQEHAQPGRVVLSAATFKALTPAQRMRLNMRALGSIALKGRGVEVRAFELLGLEL